MKVRWERKIYNKKIDIIKLSVLFFSGKLWNNELNPCVHRCVKKKEKFANKIHRHKKRYSWSNNKLFVTFIKRALYVSKIERYKLIFICLFFKNKNSIRGGGHTIVGYNSLIDGNCDLMKLSQFTLMMKISIEWIVKVHFVFQFRNWV